MIQRPTDHSRRLALFGAVAAMLLAATLAPLAAPRAVSAQQARQSIDPNWSPPPTVYIPETGQMLDRLFLDFWRGGGAAASFGNPITPEIGLDDGRIVQYLEYARFEYWPNGDANGNYVAFGDIGQELRPQLAPRNLSSAGDVAR